MFLRINFGSVQKMVGLAKYPLSIEKIAMIHYKMEELLSACIFIPHDNGGELWKMD